MFSVRKILFLLLGLSVFPTCVSVAEEGNLSCASQFSDNMVLQRDVKVPVWGWSSS